ncbi:motility associated factor glycosyltransferase family protein [Campylobacter sp. CNRCH_2014_2452]|uniref:motility associated factor glycosyltransferase family protein n=1 Tax=Campylobacter sp. CNRCH_2014_2452 TaxID=2911603 RepID=UPI00127ED329|nr:motility associated factor glycosyltransferase family protein [Campylobacter sp. CNRCH_2014_2452]EAK9891379.1 motility associated factor glycosyltransferase family protein [Campylobacter lari]MCV3486335.1 motility associated factor glycosyltransferase family protein [Campylobacter sp. CNRCH_2014_2452]
MEKHIFNKNLEALKNKKLKEKLENFKPQNFQILQGKDSLDINFIHHGGGYTLYSNTLSELNEKLNLYNDKYLLYPVLYFYGFGNGILYKALLQNKNRQKIVIFEKEIEFIYLSFRCIDFSEELENNSLIILDTSAIDVNIFEEICSNSPFFNFLRTYFLDLHCDYYEKYQEDIIQTNKNMQIYIKKSIFRYGNDSIDALQGIENFVYNLPDIISNYSFKELLLKRKKQAKNAIIVSTGPSLIKQLPLLKQYANYASIFCADSAYPILAKHNIKPDYVLSLERVIETSEFFNNDFGDFDKNIVFVLKSLIHPITFKHLKSKYRKTTLINYYTFFTHFIGLHNFGYMDMGHSVATMAYFLALNLDFKNIIFIGQDLAYADDGASHPEEYYYGKYDTYNPQEIDYSLTTLAYNGNHYVKTNEIWILFKTQIEEAVFNAKKFLNITTYNCTEGGARINHTIEKPFKQVCKELLTKELKKPFAKLEKLNENKQKELMLKAFYKIHQVLKLSHTLIKECIHLSNKLNFIGNDEKNFSLLIKELDCFKTKFEKINVLKELVNPLNTQFELNLARIYVLNPKTKEDVFNKNYLWIKEHLEWLELIIGHIKKLQESLEKNITNLEKELINKNLQKQISRIKNTLF